VASLADIDGLDAAAIMHSRVSTLPAATTVGELRAYFAASDSRKLALLVDGERFAGAVAVEALAAGAAADAPAAELAQRGPTVPPDAPAERARDLALADPTHRLPVVDGDGRLLGIVAIDTTLTRFCGT
jgi:CBS domain-containing protein